MANKMAMSVTGPLALDQLGPTLMHEHLLCDLTHPSCASQSDTPALTIDLNTRFEIDYEGMVPGNHRLNDLDVAAAELTAFKDAGGMTIVELTTRGICPDPQGLRQLSKATGVSIVLGAGFYTDDYVDPDTRALSVEALSQQIVEQLRGGRDGDGVRCGIIGEIGVSWPMTPFERRSLIAAARAQSITGAAINVHPGRHPDACHEICNVLDSGGADLSRVILSHMDRTYPEDIDAVVSLARRVVVEYDFFGIETSNYWMGPVDLPNDWMRLRALRALFDAGLGHNVTISHDICTRTRLRTNGGHGYRHLLANVVPLMRDRRWGQDEIDQLLIHTPARLLAIPDGAERPDASGVVAGS